MSNDHIIYTVGEHGPPTKETAPHGYFWRRSGGEPRFQSFAYDLAYADTEWWPAPAPPTERAPKPEPPFAAGDIIVRGHGTANSPRRYAIAGAPTGVPNVMWVNYLDGLGCSSDSASKYRPTPFRAVRKDSSEADILNTYERDGIVARPRPWQEAPDDDTVVLLWGGWRWFGSTGADVRRNQSPWLPMPPAPEGVESDG